MEQAVQKAEETLKAAATTVEGVPEQDLVDYISYERIGNSHNFVGLKGKRQKTQEEKDGKVLVDEVNYIKDEKGEVVASEVVRREKTEKDFEFETYCNAESRAQDWARDAAKSALEGTNLEVDGDGDEYTSFTISITRKI
jgi:hypothetical protein